MKRSIRLSIVVGHRSQLSHMNDDEDVSEVELDDGTCCTLILCEPLDGCSLVVESTTLSPFAAVVVFTFPCFASKSLIIAPKSIGCSLGG